MSEQPETETSPPRPPVAARRFAALLAQPRLPLWLALASSVLVLPTLGLGFHLDDHIHRFLFSGLPGSHELLRAYESPFGIANGEPAVNHWQIEAGYAPWWTYPDLLISLLRPLSTLSHQLDAALWPASAPLQHAHSLVWHFLLLLAAGWLYRGVIGAGTAAGLAALLYAFDHTHGFALGWIANRNAFIAGAFGVASIASHAQGRARAQAWLGWLSPLAFACALFAGEGAIAAFGYLLAFALFLDRRPRRFLALAPHLLVIALWRAAYAHYGRGARFSGLYIDPVHEPLHFALAALERAPVLLLGQLGLPPAEAYMFGPAGLAPLIWVFAALVTALLVLTALPFLRSDPRARFFAFGLLGSLVPACTTHPNNRLLIFAGIGAMGLLSLVWHGLLEATASLPASRAWQRTARGFTALAVGFHLVVSPFLLPFTALSIALTSQAEVAVESALAGAAVESAPADAAGDRELVIINSPDFYYVKLVPVIAALEGRPAPRRLRALAFGAQPLRVTRSGPSELTLEFQDGLLSEPLLELYRARSLPLPAGSRVELEGLDIEVTALNQAGLVARARFRFAHSLEDPRYRFLQWKGERYAPFLPPEQGGSMQLEAAQIRFGL